MNMTRYKAKDLTKKERENLLGTNEEGHGFFVDDDTTVLRDGKHFVTLDLFFQMKVAEDPELQNYLDEIDEIRASFYELV